VSPVFFVRAAVVVVQQQTTLNRNNPFNTAVQPTPANHIDNGIYTHTHTL
jgi:hypothetical protein